MHECARRGRQIASIIVPSLRAEVPRSGPRSRAVSFRPRHLYSRTRRMKILVIKRDKIGDLLLTTPMLAHLKASRPQAEIQLLANDYNAWVVAGNPHVDR